MDKGREDGLDLRNVTVNHEAIPVFAFLEVILGKREAEVEDRIGLRIFGMGVKIVQGQHPCIVLELGIDRSALGPDESVEQVLCIASLVLVAEAGPDHEAGIVAVPAIQTEPVLGFVVFVLNGASCELCDFLSEAIDVLGFGYLSKIPPVFLIDRAALLLDNLDDHFVEGRQEELEVVRALCRNVLRHLFGGISRNAQFAFLGGIFLCGIVREEVLHALSFSAFHLVDGRAAFRTYDKQVGDGLCCDVLGLDQVSEQVAVCNLHGLFLSFKTAKSPHTIGHASVSCSSKI